MQKYKYIPIKDMKVDDAFEGFFLLKNPMAKTTQSGKAYLQANLADATGEIESIYWDYDENSLKKCAGNPVKVRGTVTEYNGKRQITISLIRESTDQDQIDLSKLVPMAPIDPQQTLSQMVDLINTIQDKDFKDLCFTILERKKDMFCCIPAAKAIHHAFRYGLLMHTFFMMCHMDHMARFYPFLNRDLLIAGTFCHDIAKIEEFSYSSLGLVNSYTVPGQLLGHLYMGAKEVSEIAKEKNLPDEKAMLIQHMLLSHHGKPEYGACVVPKIAEAQLLHMIDDMDAKMEVYRETIDSAQSPGMTDKIWALDTRVYIHS